MAKLNLGKVKGEQGRSFSPKGEWFTDSSYVYDDRTIDVVEYQGSSYYCKTSHTSSTSITPTNTVYWTIVAQKGDQGIQGIQGEDGIQGVQGERGEQGLPGIDGLGSGDMLKSTYDTNNNGKVDIAELAESVPWTGVSDKPTSLPANGGDADTVGGHSSSHFEDLVTAVSDRVVDNLASINDLELSKIDKANIVNNGITTEDGTVLDGRYGANLQGQVTTLNNDLVTHKADDAKHGIYIDTAQTNIKYKLVVIDEEPFLEVMEV